MPRHNAPDPAVLRAVLEDEGSVTAAAVKLGVSRRTVHRWIKALGIRVERRVVGEAA
jgi:transcriptional regulator of acetoin/glycerol metabolism